MRNIAANRRSDVALRNIQRDHRVNTRLLRRIALRLAERCFAGRACELTICLLSASAMARLNTTHLQHSGPTDVITFDYSEPGSGGGVQGEIFLCVAEAGRQAREFRTTWQQELVRYLVHGSLHLIGYDDRTPAKRRVMKREENRLVRQLAREFDLGKLGR